MKRTAAFTALMTLVLFGSAAANFKLMPLLHEEKISRGGRASFAITLVNLNKTPQDFTIWTADMDVNEDGTPIEPTKGLSSQRGCGDWIKIDTTDFILNPNEMRSVTVKINAPKNCEGSYSGFIYFQEKEAHVLTGEPSKGLNSDMEIRLKMYCLLFVTVPSAKNSATIEPDTLLLEAGKATNSPITTNGTGSQGWRIEVPVKNTGNIITYVTGSVSIWDQSKKLVGRADLTSGRGYVLPQRRRTFVAQGSKGLDNGSYLIKANLQTAERKTVGGLFTYTVMDGKVYYGSGTDEIKKLVEASKPRFILQKRFLEFNATSGAKRTSGTTVRNLTDDYLHLKAVPISVLTDDQGTLSISEASANKDIPSCRSWISVIPDTFTLAPKGSATLKITLAMPDSLAGEYYAALLIRGQNESSDIPTAFLLPNSIFISAVSAHNAKKSCEIVHYKDTVQGIGGCLFELAVKNTGNAHCYFSGQLSMENNKGETMGEKVEFGSNELYVLPSSTYKTLIPYSTYMPPGAYKAYLTVVYDPKTKPLTQEIDVKIK